MGTISIEHGNRLFWLGRYTERVFTTLKALEKQYDKMIDEKPDMYQQYLECFGIEDTYGNKADFLKSFLFDKENQNSVAYSLERAYDNGIVLREDISTEALSFIQMGMDTLEKIKDTPHGLLYALLPLEDILFGFWGCIEDYIYDEEIKTIIKCGKCVERLDLYYRLRYPFADISMEFDRLCDNLRKVPKNTPYRYNTKQLSVLVEAMGLEDNYIQNLNEILKSLGNLFEQ
ncbi:alpha-E domain-containing protein [Porcipelethomonas sp.]|uniref:alpha-E domain-containing protein n=1 Tax=Porcipelethomonas sp. TaxID=2981675 RepID=UPI003EF2E3B5